jgi:hypothetical protein
MPGVYAVDQACKSAPKTSRETFRIVKRICRTIDLLVLLRYLFQQESNLAREVVQACFVSHAEGSMRAHHALETNSTAVCAASSGLKCGCTFAKTLLAMLARGLAQLWINRETTRRL